MTRGDKKTTPSSPFTAAKPPDVPETKEISLRELMGDARIVVIRSGADRYILRLTRQNKLLLTK